MTNKYTGLGVSGMDAATSISIGYMGESYIDFGPVGMVVPIFGIGLFIGWIYRWLVHHAGVGYVVGMGLASSVIISAAALETTAPKTFGGLAVGVLIAWVFVRFGARGLMQIVRA